jgi:outer membrane protein assembly factor BamB
VANGVVYVGSDDHKMYALDASTGNELWSYNTGDEVTSSPAVVNGELYFGSGDGNIYAFDLTANATNHAVARPSASRLKPNRGLRLSN